jgi:hypothetical protein
MTWWWRWQASEVADKLGLTDVLTTRVPLAHAVAPACSGNVFVFAVPLLAPLCVCSGCMFLCSGCMFSVCVVP